MMQVRYNFYNWDHVMMQLMPIFIMRWGCISLLMKDSIRANRAFKTALQWNPNHILSINSLAAIESDVNDNFEAAEQLYNDALRIDPNNILTLMNLAFGYLNEDRIKESEAFFKKVLKINPHEASALYNIGMIAKNINNDYHTAEASYFEL